MAPLEPPSTIALRVKVPPGHGDSSADEFTLGGGIPTSDTVAQIRQRIQNAIPSRPAPDRQRLLYGGRALVDDEQRLAEALNVRRDPTQTEYVLHLVVRGGAEAGVPDAGAAAALPAARGPPNHPLAGLRQPGEFGSGPPPQISRNGLPLPPFVQHGSWNRLPPPPGFPQYGLPPMPHLPAYGQLPGQTVHGQMPSQHQGSQEGGHVPGHTETQQPNANAGNNGNATTEDRSGATPSETPQNPPQRPVSNQGLHVEGIGPNGQRFAIHQHTLSIPRPGFPPNGMPFGMGNMPYFAPMQVPQIPNPHHPNSMHQIPPFATSSLPRQVNREPTALDRARTDLAEARRLLDQLRSADDDAEENSTRFRAIEERFQAINDYIDPFGSGNVNAPPRMFPARQSPSSATTSFLAPHAQRQPLSVEALDALSQQQPPRQSAQAPADTPHDASRQVDDTTCYLLSSPAGPQAIIYHPSHGVFTSPLAINPQLHPQTPVTTSHLGSPTPTTALDPALQAALAAASAGAEAARVPGLPVQNGDGQQPNQQQQAQGQPQQQQQPPEAEANALGPLQAALGHMWLLFRVLLFAYFLLGANMGWRRPLILFVIGFGFYLVRVGLFGDGGALRRWWEGIMLGPQPAQAAQPQQQIPQQPPPLDLPNNPNNNNNNIQQPAQPPAAENRMPTPEQLAARLLRDAPPPPQNPYLAQFREFIRPAERAAALFVASLWPGVGEAAVRAREADERRRNEEEVARRRREEEVLAEQRQALEGNAPPGSGSDGAAKEEEKMHLQDAEGVATSAGTNPATHPDPETKASAAPPPPSDAPTA